MLMRIGLERWNTSLVFSTSGGIGKAATVMVSIKLSVQPYCKFKVSIKAPLHNTMCIQMVIIVEVFFMILLPKSKGNERAIGREDRCNSAFNKME